MSKQGAIVTWARGGSSLNAIRSLGMKGIKVVAIDSLKDSPGFHSRYTAKALLCPNYHDDFSAYVQFLQETCRNEDCSVVLPMDEVSIYTLSKYSSDFSKLANVTWPDYKLLETVQNREKLFNLAKELNIPIPRYFIPDGDIKNTDGISGPWVLKPKHSLVIEANQVIQGGVRYASNIAELNKMAKEMILRGQDPIIQEYIPGGGYGFFALYNKGCMNACFEHHRLRESSYFGGAASYRESIYNPKLEEEGLKIPERLKWNGPLMVEFRRDERDGKFKLMEINPRFWGSLNLAICSGVDFPYLFYKMATEGECDRVFSYKAGVRCKNFSWELLHLFSLLKDSPLPAAIPKPSFWKTFLSVIFSNFMIKDDYISVSDPSPFAHEVLITSKKLKEYLIKRK